jgi:hypothetical protein
MVKATFCTICCIRFLKKAICELLALEEITCEDLTNDEWLVLHQMQDLLLETMSILQRALEDESAHTDPVKLVVPYKESLH